MAARYLTVALRVASALEFPLRPDGTPDSRWTVTRPVVIVTGSRDLDDEEIVCLVLNTFEPRRVLVGCCPTGADLHARLWCYAHSMVPEVHSADWTGRGRKAGPERNQRMIDAAPAGAIVLAFPRGGPGTADCMRRARAAGLLVREF